LILNFKQTVGAVCEIVKSTLSSNCFTFDFAGRISQTLHEHRHDASRVVDSAREFVRSVNTDYCLNDSNRCNAILRVRLGYREQASCWFLAFAISRDFSIAEGVRALERSRIRLIRVSAFPKIRSQGETLGGHSEEELRSNSGNKAYRSLGGTF
jgi:hypothetical protein